MTAITFDTLKFVQTLKSAGIDERQAEAFSRAFREAQHESDLATKADLRETEQRLFAKVAGTQVLVIVAITAILKFLMG
uniref:DUF1640 domain-containing protein n=1 Tax=Candidatus Kentrum sp. DK TaxID=2126562 RepID=A0A450SDB9_9GAMM|nr:MAG: hypothetical protein BECKDK2373B_GA0170837_102816 [Candidatus Kentron sp. DK]